MTDRNKRAARQPLRKVLRRDERTSVEVLACGHCQYAYSNTYVTKRRCWRCPAMAKKEK